ncbi:hypothetical protein GGR51DRAFT_496755 [Nemania sp. FL0031]|nr:hypothetical protein GGR51DRAFT_496755 [Nemania sp. FL0031]
MASEGTKGAPLSAIVGELSSTAAPTMSGDDQDATALSAGTPAGRRRGRRLPWLNDQIPEEKANMVLDQQKSALAKGPSQQKKRANDHFQDTIYMTPLKYRKCSDLSREVMQDSNHERTDDDVIFLEERFSKMTGREISPPEVRGKESGGDEVGSLWPASCQLFGYTAQCKGMSPEQRERFRLDAEARSAAVVWVMAEETAIASSDVEL